MKHGLLPIAISALFISASATQAQYLWTNNTNGTHNWSTTGNWQDGNVPANPTSVGNQVQFVSSSNPAQTNFTVVLDTVDESAEAADQILSGGMIVQRSTSGAGNLTFNLNSRHLILDGASLQLMGAGAASSDRTILTFTGGTLQIGTASNFANLILGGNSAVGAQAGAAVMAFSNTAILDTTYTSSILLSANDSNVAGGNNTRLDLSLAKFASDRLSVSDSIQIGYQLNATPGGTGQRHKFGELRLAVVSDIDIQNDLILGQSIRTSNNTNADARGTLVFSTAEAQGEADMHIGRDLRMGVGAGATGSITNAPDELNLTFGSETERGGVVHVGYKNVTAATASGNAVGTFLSNGGTISGHITGLNVGRNDHETNGTATGTFDFADAALGVLDISGDAVIGQGLGAQGSVRFSGGDAESRNLTVGNSTGAARSLLSLNNTLWTVEESLLLGLLGDITLASGAQIDLLSDQAADFTILIDTETNTKGILTVDFADSGPYWGVRIAGNTHEALLQGYLDSGRLAAAGAFANLAGVFTDGQYTYFGIAIPEPSAALLLMLGGFGVMVLKHRRRAS